LLLFVIDFVVVVVLLLLLLPPYINVLNMRNDKAPAGSWNTPWWGWFDKSTSGGL